MPEWLKRLMEQRDAMRAEDAAADAEHMEWRERWFGWMDGWREAIVDNEFVEWVNDRLDPGNPPLGPSAIRDLTADGNWHP